MLLGCTYNPPAVASERLIILGSKYNGCETEKRKLQVSQWIRHLGIYPETLSKPYHYNKPKFKSLTS